MMSATHDPSASRSSSTPPACALRERCDLIPRFARNGHHGVELGPSAMKMAFYDTSTHSIRPSRRFTQAFSHDILRSQLGRSWVSAKPGHMRAIATADERRSTVARLCIQFNKLHRLPRRKSFRSAWPGLADITFISGFRPDTGDANPLMTTARLRHASDG